MENKPLSEIRTNTKDTMVSVKATKTWKKPMLFKNKKRCKNNAFDVELEHSSQESENHLLQESSTSSEKFNKTSSQDTSHNFKNLQLFKDKRRQLQDVFDIDFEESKQFSTPEDSNEKNVTKIRKVDLFQNKRKTKYNGFDVDFEESEQISTPENADEESVTKTRKLDLFQNKRKTKYNAFDIDFEESEQISTPENADEESVTKTRNSNPFLNKKQSKYNGFDIDFEESEQISTPENADEESVTKTRNSNPFLNKKQSKYNAFDVDFEESKQISTPENADEESVTKTRNSNPFLNKKQSKYNAFDIDFEESTTGTVTVNTPTLKDITPFRLSEKNLSGETFDVNYDKSNITSDLSSVRAARTENSFLKKSRDINESIGIPRDKSVEENHSRLDVSSFNDENLNNWMSDDSDCEIKENEILEESIRKKSLPISPPLKTGQLNVTSDEDLEKQFQMKLEGIIQEATNSRTEKSTVFIPETKNAKILKKQINIKEKKTYEKKPRLAKPAYFANKRLYDYVIKKIRPKYGIDSVIQAEEIIKSICEVVKIVMGRKTYQKKIIKDLKVEMAKYGIIETTNDFYIFVRGFLPHDFIEKVIPCVQPGTNIVYPPKDPKNPFDKILNN